MFCLSKITNPFSESFNVTTISSSLASTFTDRLIDTPEDSVKTASSTATSVSSSASQPALPCQLSSASTTAEQTFPIIAGPSIDIKVPCVQVLLISLASSSFEYHIVFYKISLENWVISFYSCIFCFSIFFIQINYMYHVTVIGV